ncbi:hypothetical protein MASR2M54_25520 [Aliarcobacter cryaerophilus]
MFVEKNGKIKIFKGKKADVSNTHGTGCSFSASIASLIARDKSLCKSIKKSKQYIYKAIKNAPNFGRKWTYKSHFINKAYTKPNFSIFTQNF